LKNNLKNRKINVGRRSTLKRLGAIAAYSLGFPYINFGSHKLFASTNKRYSNRSISLVTENIVIDMLGLITLNVDTQKRWGSAGDGISQKDINEFKSSGINVFHHAYGVGGKNQTEAKINCLNFIGSLNSLIANRPDVFMRIDSIRDMTNVMDNGKVGVMLGIQNASHFITEDDVDLFHDLGQRVSQLTYNSRNMIGNGSTERIDGGISDFGSRIIERMNKVGMAIDVSHCGDQTTLDAFDISKKPVLITHSNVRALNPSHPRCKTDEAIKKMAKNGSVIGITNVRNFVKATEPTTIEHLLDQFDYVRDLVGSEHLGIGSDIDLHGYDDTPAKWYKELKAGYKGSYAFREKIDIEGVDHPKRMFDLTDGLIRRGYSDREIRGILGKNFKRVLSKKKT
jgi:membrane dipeptidase